MTLKITPFHALHTRAGARMQAFAGWDMPVQFSGILAEHRAVREGAGLFDISHMGQLWVAGPTARKSLDGLLTRRVADLPVGQGRFALLCNESGGVLDDLFVYCLAEDKFLLVVNASRLSADLDWITPRLLDGTTLNEQLQPAALALQGPRAEKILASHLPACAGVARHGAAEYNYKNQGLVVARTGYTGEDGFEVFGPAGHVYPLYHVLVHGGPAAPCGLGARDTLRLEMGYPLHGHELDETHTPLEAGLGWVVCLDKDFVGRAALAREKAQGSRRRLIGFRLKEGGVPRAGCPFTVNGVSVGQATSGGYSPTLKAGIGMGYVDNTLFPTGTDGAGSLCVTLYGRTVPADAVTPPFVRPAGRTH